MVDDFCAGNLNMKGAAYFEDTINQIDDSTGTWTSTYMCTSDVCACPANTDFTLWKEEDLNSWNRTYTAAGVVKGYKMLYKNVTGISYNTFYDCYKYLLTQKNS